MTIVYKKISTQLINLANIKNIDISADVKILHSLPKQYWNAIFFLDYKILSTALSSFMFKEVEKMIFKNINMYEVIQNLSQVIYKKNIITLVTCYEIPKEEIENIQSINCKYTVKNTINKNIICGWQLIKDNKMIDNSMSDIIEQVTNKLLYGNN